MSSTPEDLEKEAEKMKELRPISVVVITIVVAVVIGAGAGWFVVKRQAQRSVMQNWQAAQQVNKDVLQKLASLEKSESGLNQAADAINLHLSSLRDFKERNDRLVGISPRYATTLCDSWKYQTDFFETLLTYCQTKDGVKLNSAIGRADSWKRKADIITVSLPQAAKMPDSQMLDAAILRLQQVVGACQLTVVAGVPTLAMPVPPPPNSSYMQQVRLLLGEYKGTRLSFGEVLDRYNPNESWYSFKNRSDYRAEVNRRLSIRRRLENLYPTTLQEQSIQSSFISSLNYALDVMDSDSREGITMASQLINRQLEALAAKIGG